MEARTIANRDEPIPVIREENDGDKTPTATEYKSKKHRAGKSSSWSGSANNIQDKVFAKYVYVGFHVVNKVKHEYQRTWQYTLYLTIM
jgi:hypothetical protein